MLAQFGKGVCTQAPGSFSCRDMSLAIMSRDEADVNS
jgi:hypothetical protein